MTFPERVVYQKALQMSKTIHCDAPDYLTTYFTFTSEIHTRLLRSSSTYHLYTPRPRHELFHHSFLCSGASVWNALPVNIQNASNVKQFKRLYLRWFRNSARYLYYAMLHRLKKISNVCQKYEFNVMTDMMSYMYTWHLLRNHIAMFYGTV